MPQWALLLIILIGGFTAVFLWAFIADHLDAKKKTNLEKDGARTVGFVTKVGRYEISGGRGVEVTYTFDANGRTINGKESYEGPNPLWFRPNPPKDGLGDSP